MRNIILSLTVAALAFTSLAWLNQSPWTCGTSVSNSVTAVAATNLSEYGIVHRLVVTGPTGSSVDATGTVYLVDLDGTAITNATLSTTGTNGTASTVTFTSTWYVWHPVVTISNASRSNLTFKVNATSEK